MPRPPAPWTKAELTKDAARSKRLFVADRKATIAAEQVAYAAAVQSYTAIYQQLLTATNDLTVFNGTTLDDRVLMNAARYLAVPPISTGDLDTITDAGFGKWFGQKTNAAKKPNKTKRDAAANLLLQSLATDRAPWLAAKKPSKPAQRKAWVAWAASIPATQQVLTARRSSASARQEAAIRAAVAKAKYTAVNSPGSIGDPTQSMTPATYAQKARVVAGSSCDVPVRLKATHSTGVAFLAIEAKVSNTALNSRKRLKEVRDKQVSWDGSGFAYTCRTGAVLAGAYKVDELLLAQQNGVIIWWEHRLSDLTSYLK